MGQFPTMQDVADAAGVSRMTVSLALRRHPSIPQKTVDRILKIAGEVGYRPNPLVSSLMAQMRRTQDRKVSVEIAYLLEGKTWRDNPTLFGYYQGAKQRASELGFELVLFDLVKEPLSDARLKKILWTRNIQGLVVAPHFKRKSLDLDWSMLSPVAISYCLPELPLTRVSTNHFNNTLVALKALSRKKLTRAALAITVSLDKGAVRSMLAGFRVAAKALPGDGHLEYVRRQWRKEHFLQWVRRHQPEVVLGIGETIRKALAEEAQSSGRHYHYIQMNLQDSDRFGGIDQNSLAVGAVAIECVAEQLYSNVRGIPKVIKTTLINGRWIEGETSVL